MATTQAEKRLSTARQGVEFTVVRGFLALRGFDLVQAAVAVGTGSLTTSTNPVLDGTMLALTLVESVLISGWLVRRRAVLPLRWPIVADLALSLAAIIASSRYLNPGDRTGVWTMWAYPLSLSTAALLGATVRRWRWMFAGAGLLATCYVVVVAVPLAGNRTGQATALANALAFPGFALVAQLFLRFVRRLADTADAATARVTELERDRSRAVVHDLLPYLKLDRFAEADQRTRLDLANQARAKYEQMRSYVDGSNDDHDLESCVRSVLGIHGSLAVRADIRPGPGIRLSEEVLQHLQQAMDTALANVEQYAPEAAVIVSASVTGEYVEVVVADDGPGFDPASARPGYGIAEVLGRQLERVGGVSTVRSAPGGGTLVRIKVPQEPS